MTNPLFQRLPPGPQRDEAEAESQMATARATIARLERELAEMRDAIEAAHQSTRSEREIGQRLAREWQDEAHRLMGVLARAQATVVAAAPPPPIRVDCSGMSHDEVRAMLAKRPAQPSGNPGDFAEVVKERDELRIQARATTAQLENVLDESAEGAWMARALDAEREMVKLRADVAKWRSLWEMERDAGNAEHKRLEAKLAAAGDFAALAERIAFADGKHPRDLPDGEPSAVRGAEKALEKARDALLEEPAWARALNCELCEVDVEFAKGDMERFADELLDVATVAMRWRRAVLEGGKR